jgi:hypothetical protein
MRTLKTVVASSLVIGVTLIGQTARGDSPLTSIDLAPAYPDVPAVREAAKTHFAAGIVLDALLSTAPNDHKAAVVNALGWSPSGQKNAVAFLEAIARAKVLDRKHLELKDLSPAERFVAGYLIAMDDYLELRPIEAGADGVVGMKPVDLLESAARALPNDFAVQYVHALVRAQLAMSGSWCSVFQIPRAVVERFPKAKRNLRPSALKAAEAYLSAYAEDCRKHPN